MGKAAGDPVYERFGREYDAAQSQRVKAEGDCVRFSPDWTGSADGFDGLAYGMYKFDLTGYAGASSFSLAWADAPGNLSNVWLGLSDWEQGRWEWFACPAGGTLGLPDPPGLAPYTKAGTGEMLAVIVMTGQEPGVLHQCGMQFNAPVDYWPVFGHDVKHTGRSMNLGPTTNALKWKFKTHDAASGLISPVVAADGTAYTYGSRSGLTALNPDGTARWQQQAGTVYGLALAPAGTLYAGLWETETSSLAAIDADGNRLWTYTPDAPSTHIYAPAVGADGAVYFTASQYLYVLNPDGTLRGKFGDGVGLYGQVILGADGAIYANKSDTIAKYDASGGLQWQAGTFAGIGAELLPLAVDASGAVFTCLNGVLTALNADGTARWTSIKMNIGSQPVIADDGTVFVGGYLNPDYTAPAFFAINPDGSEKWHISAATDVESPYLAPDDTVYFADDHLRAVTPGGVEQWACPLHVRGDGRITADATGRLYVVGTYLSRKYEEGRSQLYAINPAGATVWTYGAGGVIDLEAAPVIGTDGTIYFGSYCGDAYAVNPDGSEKWHYSTDARVRCAPTVTSDNDVFIVDDLGSVHALDSAGTLRWVYNLDYYTGAAFGAPVVGPDGAVYFSDCGAWTMEGGSYTPGQYHALNQDGTLKWSHTFERQMQMAATVREDGSTLVSSVVGDLHCFSPDGAVLWENTVLAGAFCVTSPIAPDNTLYFASSGLQAIAPDGSVTWSIGAASNTLGGPAIAVDGTVYYTESEDVEQDTSKLRAVSPAGVELWTSDVAIRNVTALSLDGAGCIYAGSSNGIIYVFNPDGSLKQTFDTGRGTYVTSIAIGPHNTIYAGSCDGYLCAFGE